MDVVAFQQKWVGASNLKEKTAAQSHFNDLCDLLGVPRPLDADHTGDEYTFEKGAGIIGGRDGWADVWYKGHFAWEYKGRGKDLDAAYKQLLGYKDDLLNPPLMIVSDLNIIRIHTNFTNKVKKVHEYDLNGLNQPGVLATLRRIWTDPASFEPEPTIQSVTEQAAARLGQVALGLHARGEDPAVAAHFIMQMVFCLFAEDIRLLPDRLFSQMIAADRDAPAQFQADARELLAAMNTGGRVAYKRIPHVNGGLFATIDVPRLASDEIALLHETAALDWSSIEPAIFGTLFERSLDPAKRSQLGAHYTSRADIERVVEPVVMAPLRRRWDELRAKYDPVRADSMSAPHGIPSVGADPASTREDCHSGRTRRIPVRSTSKPSRSDTMRRNALLKDVDAFLADLRAVRVLDPACGSGNFLYVALDHLLTLEKEVLTWRATVAATPLGYPQVSPRQVMGIEINEYARELAQVAVWIGYIQWMIENGFGWNEPVLEPLENIRLQDALLTFHDDGTVTETEWPEADFIIGNPPFLGGKRLRAELDDKYIDVLFTVYAGRVARESDLVCYFFEKARQQIESGKTVRAGLLATNSIRGGANREVLKRIRETGDIYMAWSDEPWILNGAAVRISIVGFDNGGEQQRWLNGNSVPAINSDLTSTTDITGAGRLPENLGIAFMGDTKGGPFDISNDLAQKFLSLPLNPNGRPNSNVVKPWVNGLDITRRPRNMWIIDFGVDMTESEAALYEAPYQYVRDHVKPMRDTNKRQSYREKWWLHVESRSGMRRALDGIERFTCTPTVAKHRLFVWETFPTIADHQLIAFAREDDYFFGVLHSRAHEVWSLRMGTSLEDRPRYTPTTCFETFPLPWPPGQEPVDDPRVIAIGEAAKELDRLRENWLNPEGATEAELKKRTLTNLYNARPTWLQNAHAAVDRAVWDAYGWPADEIPANVEEDIILSRLLALNEERSR